MLNLHCTAGEISPQGDITNLNVMRQPFHFSVSFLGPKASSFTSKATSTRTPEGRIYHRSTHRRRLDETNPFKRGMLTVCYRAKFPIQGKQAQRCWKEWNLTSVKADCASFKSLCKGSGGGGGGGGRFKISLLLLFANPWRIRILKVLNYH